MRIIGSMRDKSQFLTFNEVGNLNMNDRGITSGNIEYILTLNFGNTALYSNMTPVSFLWIDCNGQP